MYEQFLLHLTGDFLTQTNWMAEQKSKNTKEGYIACFCHAVMYTLPFIFIATPTQLMYIFISHFLIDKFELAKLFLRLRCLDLDSETGFSPSLPPYLVVILTMIIDGTFHLICNYASIRWG